MESWPERIRLLRHTDHSNHGIAASRNVGIRNARGSYIAFIDQDDLWLPEKLTRQMEVLQRFPDADLCMQEPLLLMKEEMKKKYAMFILHTDREMTENRGMCSANSSTKILFQI